MTIDFTRSVNNTKSALAAMPIILGMMWGCNYNNNYNDNSDNDSSEAGDVATSTVSTSAAAGGSGYVGGAGDADGTGGAGAAGGTSSAGGANGTGGAGGEGPTACKVAADCPSAVNECQIALCLGGQCAVGNLAQGFVLPVQTAGDCVEKQCDGAGQVTGVEAPTDVFQDSNDCDIETCANSTLQHVQVPPGTGCSNIGSGIGVCDAAAKCIECLSNLDCWNGGACVAGLCASPTCTDNIKNSNESDVDCGGFTCSQCGADKTCDYVWDCESHICTDGVCAAPTCFDNVMNGTETDDDCGGSCGSTCAADQSCSVATDCVNGVCLPEGKCDSPPFAPIVQVGIFSPGFSETKLASTDVTLKCQVYQYQDPYDADGHAVTYSYSWLVDGVPSGINGNTVPPQSTSLGQEWTCVVTPNDGYLDGTPGTASLLICNKAQGTIASDTTWDAAGSPYCVELVEVKKGATLTIGPGAKVYNSSVYASGNIKIEGTTQSAAELYGISISANHTAAEFINVSFARFYKGDGLGYDEISTEGTLSVSNSVFSGGIKSISTSNATGNCNIKNNIIENGMTVSLSWSTGNCDIKNNVFQGWTKIYLWHPKGTYEIAGNIFVNHGTIDAALETGASVIISNNVFDVQPYQSIIKNSSDSPASFIVENNSFLNTDGVALELVAGHTGASIVGINNFWNTTDLATIEAMIFDNNDDLTCSGSIPYSPFLLAPHPDTPAPTPWLP